MGQRSQIYVRVTGKEHQDEIARYFQWNFGERMVSRARGIIEYVKYYLDAYGADSIFCLDDELEKLTRIAETNFDMRDIVLSLDIFKEVQEYELGDCFTSQDNNDGQLYIDVSDECIKYAFVCDNYENPLTASQYLDEDYDVTERGVNSWVEMFRVSDGYDDEDIRYTLENIDYIKKNAELMTADEIMEFQDYFNGKYILPF